MQTSLLISPTPDNANRLLTALTVFQGLEAFTIPYWVFRAAMIILERPGLANMATSLDAYGSACSLLERYTKPRSDSSSLAVALRERMRNFS
jgi:hypothetical protein